MDIFDDFLTHKIKSDKLEFDIDNSTFNHLHYMVNLNSTKSNIKRNSIFSFVSDFLNPRFILAKVAFISILFILIIGNKQNKRHESFIFHADSSFIQKNTFDTIQGSNIPIGDSLYR